MEHDGWIPGHLADNFPTERYEHCWNENYTMFRAVRLRWWDDASYAAYAAYQAYDFPEDDQYYADYHDVSDYED